MLILSKFTWYLKNIPARDLFVRCGKKIQRRRQEKEWRIATSRVTLTEDPAEKSTELKKRLEENRRLASTKENEVLNKYFNQPTLPARVCSFSYNIN